MPEIERLSDRSDWIGLDVVEQERKPREIIEVGIHLHVTRLSLSDTKQILYSLGIEWSRAAIHNRVQKDDVRPSSDAEPNHIAVDETVIQVNDERHWLYAAVNQVMNSILNTRLFQTRTTQLTVLFLCDLREQQQIKQATFLVNGATHLASTLHRLGFDFRSEKHGNRNSLERII